MRSLILILLVLLVGLEANSREALLIGNSDYKYITDLQDPKPSITDLEEALESLDFHVTTEYDLDAENLSVEVEKFRDRLHRDSIGFFYYSGHGCQLNNRSYLVPTNVDTKKSSKIKYHALAIEEVLHTLGQARNKVNMLFLDACRDVPTGTRGGTKGLGQIDTTPKGTLVVYATESGKVAQDNTLFIKELTRTIQKPNKKVWEIGNDLSNSISAKTNDNQVPEMFSKRLPPKLTLYNSSNFQQEEKEIEELHMLTIKTMPTDAKVYITNIKPKYEDGIKLKKGIYKIKVVKDGYVSQLKRIKLTEDSQYQITLEKQKHNIRGITKFGSLMYQNQPFYTLDKRNYDNGKSGGRVWNWKGAKKYCSDLTLGGYDDWRLPTLRELNRLSNMELYRYDNSENLVKWNNTNKDRRVVNNKGYNYFIRKEFSDNMPSVRDNYKDASFWTSETINSFNAIYVNFDIGYIASEDKSINFYTLCVR